MSDQDDIIVCPSCRNDINVTPTDTEIQCGVCGEEYELAGHLCPICFTYHEDDELLCTRCGTPLTRICHNCRHVNWSGHEVCQRCAEPLDLMAQMLAQKNRSTAERLQEQMQEVVQLKEQEDSASLERMAQMVTAEERRQVELRQRTEKRQREERRVILFVSAAILILIIVAVFLVATGGTG